jgi:hypothetical protein
MTGQIVTSSWLTDKFLAHLLHRQEMNFLAHR